MKRLLVIGGARSGKSRYAEERLEALPGRLGYIATAQAHDAEMAARIDLHRGRRGERWETCEAPCDLAEAIARMAGRCDALLVDCLTLWLSNLMLGAHSLVEGREGLIEAVAACPVPIALIGNEVGLGIVPDNALARQFRDEAGLLNQAVAKVVEEVVMVAAGLPLSFKSV
ncbi:bifunctional adenosylcobinamide kinase/adenosylcobinamide-phosphate guanylyltransferase [Novosphingobium pentaromativorans]|uniref:Bifunctional adenosylcobalamin biosynthesis protein n=1 Tax=Novosphingobium pentaromativorans US6-1 TaxID=1088721 RepID=G6EIV9_9SPHN|nr:bifunctional adenosylcobinamide kinase/adenosylcobinamide-phosphate guanylyltransferase [Novosphingobium pentaromativorans]AIT78920.1 cobalamin biosynthesis protein [Novosphingobium pentaromativorans US6-1]EHJ58718.1 adenosylcobinamide kinase / adenosylcobinamide-phosphate guanylyltransferase [Novosphingobium pentaromativorans US6-1]